ncbi:hypothetical protein L3Q82_000382 [Scortum barcoo]|uniref:Uncharacterized protein n=1 Tax=Scortum barcoo TaxID=214431 RepID=A0ACB8XAN4_9TELE|nr:hypothetical protein L3Q82_000382 [Scortum barcoo]
MFMSIRVSISARGTRTSLGWKSMINFVVVSSDLRPYVLDTRVKITTWCSKLKCGRKVSGACHVLEQFAAECEAAGMRISTSKSEAMVLDQKRVVCPLRVGGVPQLEEFKYLGVLFTSEGKMEREIDRRIGAASAVMRSVLCRGE